MRPIGLALATVLAFLAAVHVYWAAGGRSGLLAAVPEIRGRAAFHPGPAACLAIAALLLAAALLLLGRSGVLRLPGPPWLVIAGTWVVGAVFALRVVGDFRLFGLFRQVTGTAFARNDAMLYTPLCAVLALGALWVAWRGPPR